MCQRLDQGGRCYHHTKQDYQKAQINSNNALSAAAYEAGVPVDEPREKTYQKQYESRMGSLNNALKTMESFENTLADAEAEEDAAFKEVMYQEQVLARSTENHIKNDPKFVKATRSFLSTLDKAYSLNKPISSFDPKSHDYINTPDGRECLVSYINVDALSERYKKAKWHAEDTNNPEDIKNAQRLYRKYSEAFQNHKTLEAKVGGAIHQEVTAFVVLKRSVNRQDETLFNDLKVEAANISLQSAKIHHIQKKEAHDSLLIKQKEMQKTFPYPDSQSLKKEIKKSERNHSSRTPALIESKRHEYKKTVWDSSEEGKHHKAEIHSAFVAMASTPGWQKEQKDTFDKLKASTKSSKTSRATLV